MMSIEAMKMALDVLAYFASDESDDGQMAVSAYWTLRQAIEQAEKQEPVAYIEHHKGGDNLRWEEVNHHYAKATPLYTAPPQREWVGLTQESIVDAFCSTPHEVQYVTVFARGARWAEAKLKEKNT